MTAALLLLIAGCKVGPDFTKPKAPTPVMWQGTEGNVSFVSTAGGRETAWWQGLGEPALDRIIAQLETQNLTLAEATARIEEARAQRRATMTQRFPTLAVDSSYTYRRFSSNGNAFVPRANSTGGFDLIGEGIDLSWEVDLWGRVKRLEEAAAADIDRSHELFRDLRIVLIAEACRTFLEARVLQHRLLIAEANRDLQRETLELTRMREEAGLTRALDVHQAATQLALTESTIPALEADLRAAVHRLCVLQGYPPVRDPLEVISIGDIPAVPSMLTVGIPCDLLRQRPDVRAAEDQVRADSARIGVATADLYPQLRVNGSISVDSRTGSQLFTTGSITHDIGPSVRWNIFQFGRVRASIAAARHRFDQSLARYRQTVLEGYEEVENALVRLETARRSEAFLETAVREARTAYEAAVIAYKHDNLAFQSVLDTERQLLAAQDEWARARGNVAQAFVELYRAMGGAWEPSAVVAERPLPAQGDSTDDSLERAPLDGTPLDESPVVLPEDYESEAAPIEPSPELVPLEPIEIPVRQDLTTSIFERLPPISDDATGSSTDESSPLWSTPVDTVPIALPHARTIERFPAVTPLDVIAPENGERTLSNGAPWPPAGGYRFAPAIRAEEPAPIGSPDQPIADRYSASLDATAIESERLDTESVEPSLDTNDESSEPSAPPIIAPLPPIDASRPEATLTPRSLDDLAPREPFHALAPIRIAPLPLETGHVPADCFRVPIGSGLRAAERIAPESNDSTPAPSDPSESHDASAVDRNLEDEMPALNPPSNVESPGNVNSPDATTDRTIPIAASADRSRDLGNPAISTGPGLATPQRIEVFDAKPLPASGAGSAVDGALSDDRSSAVIRLAPAPASPTRGSPRSRVGR